MVGCVSAKRCHAMCLGEALWLQARAEHRQAAPDASSSGAVRVPCPDTLHDAEKSLRTALDLAVQRGCYNWRMDTQMHLACVAMVKGDEDEAVELLLQYLQGWVDDVGTQTCAGCLQVRSSGWGGRAKRPGVALAFCTRPSAGCSSHGGGMWPRARRRAEARRRQRR